MANRIDLCTAVLLLLMSLPQTSLSAHIESMQHMKMLGQAALRYLESESESALKNHTEPHYTIGCIREAKEHERLNCTLISTFNSYLVEVIHLDGLDKLQELHNKLKAMRQHLEDLKDTKCSTDPVDICDAAFQHNDINYENLEKLRSILVLFIQWITKPME